ncbi:MAG: glycosyltransferase [Terracidiphilus sp.]|jgi:glycosyltransferase involved in cell wall biosynthesis
MSPAVSIVLPVYNEEAHVAAAIEQLRRQTFEDFEIILVNDGSQDRTAEIARGIDEPRLKVVDIEHSGLASALNAGIRRSCAPLIARQDADDDCVVNRLEIQLGFLSKRPEVGVLGSWASITEELSGQITQFRPPVGDREIKKELPWRNPMVHSSVVMRRSIVETVGFYRCDTIWEDYDLWLRLRDRTVFANIDQPLVERLVRRNSHFRIPRSKSYWALYGIRSLALLHGPKSISLSASTMTALTKAVALSAIGR